MQRFKDEGKDILNPIFPSSSSSSAVTEVVAVQEKKEIRKVSMVNPDVKRMIEWKEIEEHTEMDGGKVQPWFVVKGEVYDGTTFLKAHPGGAESITIVAGEDATEDFMAIHSAVSF